MTALEAQVRAVVEQLLDPAYGGMFEDLLSARRTEMDEAEDAVVREAYGAAAAGLLDELSEGVAAELALREPVAA